jgi:hypothetical protein
MVFGCINAAKTGSGDCTDPVGVTQIKWDCGANGGINGVTTQQSDLPYDCSPDYLNPTNGGIDGVTMIIRSFHCFQSSFTPSGSTPQNYTGAMEAFNNGSITNGTTCPTHIGQPPDLHFERDSDGASHGRHLQPIRSKRPHVDKRVRAGDGDGHADWSAPRMQH